MSFVFSADRNSVGRASPIRNAIAATVDARLIQPLRAIVIPRFLPRRTVELLEERHALENRARDEHLAVMAHELRNALGVVRNAARLLEPKHADKVNIESARGLIERQIVQMNRHLDDLVNAPPHWQQNLARSSFVVPTYAKSRGIRLRHSRRISRAAATT